MIEERDLISYYSFFTLLSYSTTLLKFPLPLLLQAHPHLPSPQIHSSCVLLQKRTGLTGRSTEQDTTS